jgi:hypothetical protein
LFTDIQMEETANLSGAVEFRRLLSAADGSIWRQREPCSLVAGDAQSCDARCMLQRRDIALGQPQFARLEQTAHDLAAAGLGQALLKIDFLGRNHRAQPFARMRHDVLLQRIAGFIPGPERDKSLDHLKRNRIRFADDSGFGHCRMFIRV